MRTAILFASLFFAASALAQTYDTVLQGGRVLDPETGVDAIRNVGITQGRIARISSEPLTGKRVLDAKAISGASLHIVHINSSCISVALECISMVAEARARGLDITTEAYPYIAGMTAINSALFNPGWKEKLGVGYDALQLPDTGERLTQDRFDALHAEPGNRAVLLFMNTQERVDAVIAEPLVMIASDGEDGHPRSLDLCGAAGAQRGNEVRDRRRHHSHRPGQADCQHVPGEAFAARSAGEIEIVIHDQRGEQQHQIGDGKSESADR